MSRSRALVFLLVPLVTVSCSLSNDTPDRDHPVPPLPWPPLTPETLTNAIEIAYLRQSIDFYAGLLANAFTFAITRPDGSTVELDKVDDLSSTGRLFETVDEIDLQLTYQGHAPSPDPAFPATGGFVLVSVEGARARVVCRDESDDPLIFLADGAAPKIYLRPDERLGWRIEHISVSGSEESIALWRSLKRASFCTE